MKKLDAAEQWIIERVNQAIEEGKTFCLTLRGYAPMKEMLVGLYGPPQIDSGKKCQWTAKHHLELATGRGNIVRFYASA